MREFERSLPMSLLKAREVVMKKFIPHLREYDLSPQQWRVLRILFETDGLEMSVISERCYLLMPSLSRIIQNLEARQLISRRISEKDQRRSIISLTDTDGNCASSTSIAGAGDDCGENNNQVRTQDTITYNWSITANDYTAGQANPENVVFEQILTPSPNAVVGFQRVPAICTVAGGGGSNPIEPRNWSYRYILSASF